ncbi:MAG: hypothetical protein IKS23_01930 [Alphaproteobacteria bacterium]|nr:hypothetical protein [Alphaproteobacteria bacterium]
MKAIMDRVLIRLEENEKKNGDIFLPDNFEKTRTTGEVLSVGEDVRAVKVGQKVLFHVFDELPTVQKDVVAVRENSLLAILEE